MTTLRLITLFSLASATALANPPESCDPYDVAKTVMDHDVTVMSPDALPSSLNGRVEVLQYNGAALGPTRDQDGIGYCYAYSAADMTEHWLKKKSMMPGNEHVSAMALALNHDSEFWREQASSIFSVQNESFDVLQKNYEKDRKKERAIIEEIAKLEEANPSRENKALNELSQKKLEELEEIQKKNERRRRDTDYDGRVYEGGLVAESISKNWPNQLFFESQISSRDQGYAAIIKQHENLFADRMHPPSNIKNLLGWFAQLSQRDSLSEDPTSSCALDFVKEVTPGASNLKDMDQVFQALKKYKNPFEGVLEACRISSAKPAPGISNDRCVIPRMKGDQVDAEPRTSLQSRNSKILEDLDAGLKNNEVVAIRYHADILKSSEWTFDTDRHASVITGKLKVCGADYYVLRNSWGQSACENDRARFAVSKKDKASSTAVANAQNRLNDCIQKAIKKDVFHFSQTGIVKGDFKELREWVVAEKACNEILHERAKAANVPFFCSQNGDYIIRKDYLAKGIYGHNRITN